MHWSFILSILAAAYETYGLMIVPGQNMAQSAMKVKRQMIVPGTAAWSADACSASVLPVNGDIYSGCVKEITYSCYMATDPNKCQGYWKEFYKRNNKMDIYDVCAQWEPSTYNAAACKQKVVSGCSAGSNSLSEVEKCELVVSGLAGRSQDLLMKCLVPCKSYLYVFKNRCPFGYPGTC